MHAGIPFLYMDFSFIQSKTGRRPPYHREFSSVLLTAGWLKTTLCMSRGHSGRVLCQVVSEHLQYGNEAGGV